MTSEIDLKRQARNEYIYKRKTQKMLAMTVGVSSATIGRWKADARKRGDDWDIARAAHMIAGQGLDGVITTVVEEFMLMAQHAIEELKADALKEPGERMAIGDRIKMMASLSDAMVKMTNSAGRLAPKISELGVAQDVIRRMMEFVREDYPDHANIMLEIIEPFGETLVEAFG
ncbi:MAG: DUF1804 family protein [Ahrensia sp.]|nr:DUF1804 family protein [Ahrensia sp.]